MCVLHGPMTNRELSWDCNTPELNRTFSISQVFVLILLPATSLFHLREKTLDKSHNTQPVWHQRTNRQSEATSLWTKRNMSCVFFSEVAGDQNHLLRSTCRCWWVQVQQRKMDYVITNMDNVRQRANIKYNNIYKKKREYSLVLKLLHNCWMCERATDVQSIPIWQLLGLQLVASRMPAGLHCRVVFFEDHSTGLLNGRKCTNVHNNSLIPSVMSINGLFCSVWNPEIFN